MTEHAKEVAVQSLKLKIRIFVAVVIAAVVGIYVLSSIMEYNAVIAAAEAKSAGYAQALSEHAESAFAETDRAVKDIIHDIRSHGGAPSYQQRDLYDLLRREGGEAPQIGDLFLTDASGIMFLNSLRFPPKPIDVSDRAYFRHFLQNPDADLFISKPVMSRLVSRWRFNLIRPLGEPGGRFQGLMVAAFEVEYFKRFFSAASLGRHGRVMLIRDDGAPLVYEPYVQNAYEADFRSSNLFRMVTASPTGTFHEQKNPVETSPRIVSYKRLTRFPVVAVVSLNRDDVLEPWSRRMLLHGSITGALCIVIVLLARIMFRHLDRLKFVQKGLAEQQELVRIKAAQIDAADDAILQIDFDGRLVHFNRALCTMTGYGESELAGKRLQDLESMPLLSDIIPRFRELGSGGEATFETTFASRGGREIPVEIRAREIDSDGASFILCIARDASERKKTEQREQGRLVILEEIATGGPLRETLVRIILFIEQQLTGGTCSVLLADEAGEYLVHGAAPSLPEEYNKATARIRIAKGVGSCGTAAFLRQRVVVEDIDADPYWRGFKPAHEAGLKACWSQPIVSSEGDLLGTFAIYYRETRAPSAGEIAIIESAAHLASIAIGRVRHEERGQRLEAQLRHMQRIEAIGQLAGGIAHDFNNLLTPIIIYSNMLQMNAPDDASVFRQAEKILQAANKARDLTQKLLSFGRRQMLHIQPLDLNEVIDAMHDILRRTIRENIILQTNLSPEKTVVNADRGQIEQILLNLAVNAQDAISGNGIIAIDTDHVLLDDEYVRLHPGVRPGRYVLLVFSDNGCGMDDTTLPHIFEPFFTTKPTGHGTGLGLATVYGSVKQHEGLVTVDSRPGNGTTFTIYLPASADDVCMADPRPETPATISGDAGNGTRIMIVEDNTMVREMLCDVLKMSGYDVVAAASPAEAIDKASVLLDSIDLLITDVVMPQMNGPELYGRLQEKRPDLPVIFISGYTAEVTVHNGRLEEGVNFLQKPFTSTYLLEKVAEVVNREQLQATAG